ncbi:MAG: 3-hydroxyacyl-CoA dehydrogenase NAD-binding domain-containing protein, partial [Bacteroidia bacterium]|nr:3-hydroxyacyl-CoA dehydrogenase NAD-binding domain-containing protein [Bacteroidia bacterium]
MPTSSLQRSAIEANSIAWISWFNPSDPHGYIDWSTFQQLAHDWEAACENPAISAIVIHSQGRDFSPGWNPDAWLYQDEASLEKLILDTQDFLKRLEASPKPVIAAIHGKCLGPGMELSLACHWVVTSLHSSTVFGMDERNLGLVPALGATVRLPRLVGLQTALHVLLSGRTYSSVRCLKMGLANRVVVPDQLLATAGNKANSMALGHNSPARKLALDWVQQAVERIWIGRRLILRHAAERINEITHEAFPAPQLIMDATDTGWRRGMTEGLDLALKYALHASKNPGTTSLLKLRRMALDRQQKGTTSNRSAFVRRLTVLGGGRMGKGLAKLGRKYDLHVDLIERNPFTLRNLGPWAKKRGVQIFSSEQYHPHLAAEFIIEAVDENLARKTQVLQQAESILDPQGFIATNTSTLSIQTLSESLRRPGKLVGMHFFMPPGAMPLVEIIASQYTDPTVVDQAKGLASQLGKVWIQTS